MDVAKFAVLLALGAAGASWDARTRQIPNRLTGAGLAAGLLLWGLANGWLGFLHATLGALVVAALLFLPWMLGGIGGGDLKLCAAFAALLGWPGALLGLFLSLFAMGVWSGGAVLWLRWRRVPTADAGDGMTVSPPGLHTVLPQALPIGVGAAVAAGLLWLR